jgi:lipopolysaccharide export system protein LptA
MKTTCWLVIAVVPLAWLCALVTAQQPVAPAKPPAAKPAAREETKVTWDVRFDKLDHNDSTGEGSATKVVATSGEGSVIVADLWRWNDKTKIAFASGNLNLTDEELDATAQSAEIHYKRAERLMILSGSVKLILKPKKQEPAPAPAAVKVEGGKATVEPRADAQKEDDEEPSARSHPIEILCDRVEYRYARDRKEAKLTGSFRAVQRMKENTRTLEALFAEFFGKDDRIVLYPPVRFEDAKGRKGETEKPLVLSTKEGAESLTLTQGKVTFTVEEEEEAPPAKPGAPKPP